MFAIKAGEINGIIIINIIKRFFCIDPLSTDFTWPLGDSTSKLNPKIHKVNVFLIFWCCLGSVQ